MCCIVDLYPSAPRIIRPEIPSHPVNHSRGKHARICPACLGSTQPDPPRLCDTRRGSEGCAIVARMEQTLVCRNPDISGRVRVRDDLDWAGRGAKAARSSSKRRAIVGRQIKLGPSNGVKHSSVLLVRRNNAACRQTRDGGERGRVAGHDDAGGATP